MQTFVGQILETERVFIESNKIALDKRIEVYQWLTISVIRITLSCGTRCGARPAVVDLQTQTTEQLSPLPSHRPPRLLY